MTLYILLAATIAVAFIAWRLIRIGSYKTRAKAAEETIADIKDANRPVAASERDRVRSKYRRD